MKIFITGSTGFIGSHIVEHLASVEEDLSRVALFVRNSMKTSNYEDLGARIFVGDITEFQPVSETISLFQPDVIIHAAALTNDWAPFVELKRVNVLGTENIVKAILALKTQEKPFLVHLSSSGVYGKIKKPETTYINEETPLNPKANYQKSKEIAERVISDRISKDNLRATIIRPPSVIGPRDFTQFYKIYQAIKAGKFPMINDGKAIMSWVDVNDLVEAIFLVIAKQHVAAGQVYNVKSFELSVRDLYEQVITHVGYTRPIKSYSYRLAYLAGLISEIKSKISGKPSTLNRYRVVKFGKNRLYDASKIEQELFFSPKYDAKTSIERTIEWLKSEKLD
ncbi:MAG: NAD-dependent epimerase/dehydratase family protein [Candidatus Hodarchaeales archaeon]